MFKGQSPKKIAGIVAENIRSGKSQMIGIDGGWGSGKSNLISLINKELNKDRDTNRLSPVITYNAWGHVSDLQRRSILEEITRALVV